MALRSVALAILSEDLGSFHPQYSHSGSQMAKE